MRKETKRKNLAGKTILNMIGGKRVKKRLQTNGGWSRRRLQKMEWSGTPAKVGHLLEERGEKTSNQGFPLRSGKL